LAIAGAVVGVGLSCQDAVELVMCGFSCRLSRLMLGGGQRALAKGEQLLNAGSDIFVRHSGIVEM
jgi:hypothetical protein